MLWDIRARMKPALSVIDLIPNVHRTPALSVLRRAVTDGRPATLRLSAEDRELAFHDAAVPLISPIGAQVLKALYFGGHIKLKKPALKTLPALETYIATEAAFRAEVARILLAEETKRQRLAEIVADPACARAEEITPWLIDRVMSARLGHGVYGEMLIGGLVCHRSLLPPDPTESARLRSEGRVICWWLDPEGRRCGEAA